jgi:hypothetical protein
LGESGLHCETHMLGKEQQQSPIPPYKLVWPAAADAAAAAGSPEALRQWCRGLELWCDGCRMRYCLYSGTWLRVCHPCPPSRDGCQMQYCLHCGDLIGSLAK